MTILEELPLLQEDRSEHPSAQRRAARRGSVPHYRRHGVQAMTNHRTLILIVYAPALVGVDGRTLAVVHGIERALPGVRLAWELSKAGRPIALPQRDGWLAEASARGMLPLVCNGDESYPVTVKGWGTPARQSVGGQPQFEVHAELPLDAASIAAAADLLEGVADLLSRARRTERGGWIVRLTDTPLDLDNPSHLDALLRAYERFPEIGGRVPPR
ncbi:hypothetical protein STIAU_5811 [Stigmatella aurantiaca DW4/3-1]|nr:hypothetical protein STIAU_5811 [Stigmatella aurantiaca DW4/3-1]